MIALRCRGKRCCEKGWRGREGVRVVGKKWVNGSGQERGWVVMGPVWARAERAT